MLKSMDAANRALVLAAAACLAIACMGAAHAADAVAQSTVVLPVGDWTTLVLGWSRDLVLSLIAGVIAWGGRKLPGQIGNVIKAALTDKLIAQAVDYAIGAIEGATKGKTVDVSTANQLVALAEQAALQFGPTLAKAAGDMLKPMIVARLAALDAIPAAAHADALNAPLPAPAV
jgi:hypothetical protein